MSETLTANQLKQIKSIAFQLGADENGMETTPAVSVQVSGDKLVNGSITENQLADDAVTGNKIVNDTITLDKLSNVQKTNNYGNLYSFDDGYNQFVVTDATSTGTAGKISGTLIASGTLNGHVIMQQTVSSDKLDGGNFTFPGYVFCYGNNSSLTSDFTGLYGYYLVKKSVSEMYSNQGILGDPGVDPYNNFGAWMTNQLYQQNFGQVSLRVGHSLWTEGALIVSSDKRIKCNVEDVPDHLALQQVRDIPCRYYEYKDKVKRGVGKTIGFIAQEVKEVLPMAVTTQKGVLPDHLKIAEVSWEEKDDAHHMTVSNLNDDVVAGTTLQFVCATGTPAELNEDGSVKTPASANYKEEKIDVKMNDDGTFTMEKQYDGVFIYGKEVEDFLTIDKAKIFALHHAAIQELDRTIESQKNTIEALVARLDALESKLA